MNISKNLLKNAAVLLMGAGAVCSATTSANATNARNWNGYTWARSGNLSIQLVNNTSAKWTPYLETAASQWSAAANIDYRVVTGPTVDASVCSPSYGVVEVCSANYGKTGKGFYKFDDKRRASPDPELAPILAASRKVGPPLNQ